MKTYPELAQFPYPVQRQLVGEIWAMQGLVLKGTSVPRAYRPDEPIVCRCEFYWNYTLPCRHIFHSDYVSRVSIPGINQRHYLLNEERWKQFANLFVERGFEVYALSKAASTLPGKPIDSVRAKAIALHQQQLPVRQMLEQLRATMFSLGEGLDSLPNGSGKALYADWCQRLISANQSFIYLADEILQNRNGIRVGGSLEEGESGANGEGGQSGNASASIGSCNAGGAPIGGDGSVTGGNIGGSGTFGDTGVNTVDGVGENVRITVNVSNLEDDTGGEREEEENGGNGEDTDCGNSQELRWLDSGDLELNGFGGGDGGFGTDEDSEWNLEFGDLIDVSLFAM